MQRGDYSQFSFGKTPRRDEIKWIAPAEFERDPAEEYEEYIDALAFAPRKVDVLIRLDGTPGTLQDDLLERLARHPKVGKVIIYGLPDSQRIQVAALAAMLGISLRFCDSEDEVRVLLNKRRSRVISNLMFDSPANNSH